MTYTIHVYDLLGGTTTHYRDSLEDAEAWAKECIDHPLVESVAVLPPAEPTPHQKRLQGLREQFGGAL